MSLYETFAKATRRILRGERAPVRKVRAIQEVARRCLDGELEVRAIQEAVATGGQVTLQEFSERVLGAGDQRVTEDFVRQLRGQGALAERDKALAELGIVTEQAAAEFVEQLRN